MLLLVHVNAAGITRMHIHHTQHNPQTQNRINGPIFMTYKLSGWGVKREREIRIHKILRINETSFYFVCVIVRVCMCDCAIVSLSLTLL